MDVKVFRTFLELAKVRHFGRAAENLYLTQAAVSARIKQLETYFDAPLFTRDRNNIKLTPAGERLVEHAQVMVARLQQAKQEVSQESNHVFQLTLAGTANVWDAYLQTHLLTITEQLQNHAFVAEVMSREQLNRHLIERNLDMAFAFEQIKAEELVCNKIADIQLCLVSTQPQEVETVFDSGYVYVDWGSRFASEHSLRHPKMTQPLLKTSTANIALHYLLKKGGSAYLPKDLIQPYLQQGQLYPVAFAQEWQRSIYLSYRKNSLVLDAIREVEAKAQHAFSFSVEELKA